MTAPDRAQRLQEIQDKAAWMRNADLSWLLAEVERLEAENLQFTRQVEILECRSRPGRCTCGTHVSYTMEPIATEDL